MIHKYLRLYLGWGIGGDVLTTLAGDGATSPYGSRDAIGVGYAPTVELGDERVEPTRTVCAGESAVGGPALGVDAQPVTGEIGGRLGHPAVGDPLPADDAREVIDALARVVQPENLREMPRPPRSSRPRRTVP